MTNEHWVSIIDYGLRHAMKFNYSSNECFSHQFGCIQVWKGEEMRRFAQLVNNNKNLSFGIGRGKTFNEIQSDIIPKLIWD
jgi:hypothetical protein